MHRSNGEPSFGRAVREQRRALDLTQEELAQRVGCAAITIRKIEAEELRPSQQIAERLAMALGIPLDERAAFVRAARAVRPGGRDPAPASRTPAPIPDEIGSEDLSGRAIRGYALAEKIGSGGFGVVYRAMQPLVEREVAIKIILPQYADRPDFIRRFEAEAQLVARLEHPYIVPLYDYWREPGVAYLVMRLLRAGSLHRLIQAGPIELPAIARIVAQVGAALHTAHRAGVIHRSLAFSPDGRRLVSGSGERDARVWDVASGKQVLTLKGHVYDNIFSVAYSPDGKHILTGSYDQTARLWDAGTGAEIRRLQLSEAAGGAYSVAFSRDSTQAITGSWDGVIRFWSVADGRLLRTLEGHTGPVWWLLMTKDSRYLVSGGDDATMRLWDLQSGREARHFVGHDGPVGAGTVTPDEQTIITAGTDGTVRRWDRDVQTTVRLVCARLLRDFSPDERARYGITGDTPTCPSK